MTAKLRGGTHGNRLPADPASVEAVTDKLVCAVGAVSWPVIASTDTGSAGSGASCGWRG